MLKTNSETEALLTKVYKKWQWIKPDEKAPQFTPVAIDPAELWSRSPHDLLDDVSPEKFGEYRIQETESFDPISFSPLIVNKPEMTNNVFGFVAQQVCEEYSDSHWIAGFDYWMWLCENPNLVPDLFRKENTRFFFFGSMLRDRDGRWMIPGYEWYRGENCEEFTFLNQIWFKYDRAVVLKK